MSREQSDNCWGEKTFIPEGPQCSAVSPDKTVQTPQSKRSATGKYWFLSPEDLGDITYPTHWKKAWKVCPPLSLPQLSHAQRRCQSQPEYHWQEFKKICIRLSMIHWCLKKNEVKTFSHHPLKPIRLRAYLDPIKHIAINSSAAKFETIELAHGRLYSFKRAKN